MKMINKTHAFEELCFLTVPPVYAQKTRGDMPFA